MRDAGGDIEIDMVRAVIGREGVRLSQRNIELELAESTLIEDTHGREVLIA